MKTTHFILIDDELIHNAVLEQQIITLYPDASVQKFTDPTRALAYIRENYQSPDAPQTILLLDIRMPLTNGWDFLECVGRLDAHVHQCIRLYILSSSVDQRDISRAYSHELVMGYLRKPVGREQLRELMMGT